MSSDPDREPAADNEPGAAQFDERPLFRHPRWMIGVVLVFGVVAIVAGLENPVWWLVGFPCILTLFVWIWVRMKGAGGP
jgi:hypothetical protein